MVAEDGAAFAAWHGAAQAREGGGRFCRWLAEWRAETTADVRLPVECRARSLVCSSPRKRGPRATKEDFWISRFPPSR